jgi:hypothetical protein
MNWTRPIFFFALTAAHSRWPTLAHPS